MDPWHRGRLCAGSRAAGTAPRENLKNTPGEEATEDVQLAVLAAMEETRRESDGRFDWCLFPDWDEFVVSQGSERSSCPQASIALRCRRAVDPRDRPERAR